MPWFLHGLCVAPRLPPMTPVNLGTCKITPKSTVLTTSFGAIVPLVRLAPMGKPVLLVLLVLLSSASSAAWVISWIECELLGGGRGGMIIVFKFPESVFRSESAVVRAQ